SHDDTHLFTNLDPVYDPNTTSLSQSSSIIFLQKELINLFDVS
ncbi:7258_t:CDS:1, partial [Racocetra fulgida]